MVLVQISLELVQIILEGGGINQLRGVFVQIISEGVANQFSKRYKSA